MVDDECTIRLQLRMIDRLEVWLDSEHRERLAAIVSAGGKPVSEVVRQMIDETYEDVRREERRRAARAIAVLAIEDVPDSDVLKRQFETADELPDLR
jgi:hypothetical protein